MVEGGGEETRSLEGSAPCPPVGCRSTTVHRRSITLMVATGIPLTACWSVVTRGCITGGVAPRATGGHRALPYGGWRRRISESVRLRMPHFGAVDSFCLVVVMERPPTTRAKGACNGERATTGRGAALSGAGL